MGQILHPSARTTSSTRRKIQNSKESITQLAKKYGIARNTVWKWKKRNFVHDAPRGVNRRHSTVLSREEEAQRAEDFLLVYCMIPDEEAGERLSRHLLSLKLIACANLFPQGKSFYEWEGKFQNSSEQALICKTKKSLYKKMSEELIKHHPYECPGLCAFPFSQAHQPFLKWIDEQCPSN